MDLSSNDLAAMFDGAPLGPGPRPHYAHDYAQRVARSTTRRTRDVICLRCRTIDHCLFRRVHCRFCVGDVIPYTPPPEEP